MALPQLTDLKTFLKITDNSADDALQLNLDAAIEWVHDFTGRYWIDVSAAMVVDEEYDLDSLTQTTDGMYIQLRQMDIISIDSVKLGDVALDADDYKWNEEGRLVIYGRIWDVARRAYNDFQYVKVSYTYGVLPNKAVSSAIIMLAMAYWNDYLSMNATTAQSGVGSESTANQIKSERVGDYQVQYSGGSSSASNGASSMEGGNGERSTGTINSVSRLLNSYRKRRI